MKSEILNKLFELTALANALPDDPIPAPSTLTGLRVASVYGFPINPDDSVTHIELTWSDPDGGCGAILEVIGAAGNTNGPMGWMEIPVNGTRGPNGEWATHHLNAPAGQAIVFRLSQIRHSDGQQSAFIEMAFPTLEAPSE